MLYLTVEKRQHPEHQQQHKQIRKLKFAVELYYKYIQAHFLIKVNTTTVTF